MKALMLQVAAIVPIFLLHGVLSFVALMIYLMATVTVSTTNTAKTRALSARVDTVVGLTNTAQNSANNAQSTANSAQSTANSAQATANSAQSTANSVQSQVGSLNIPQSRGGGMTSAPASYTQAWGASVVNEVTQINNSLGSANIFV